MSKVVESWETSEYKFRKHNRPVTELRIEIARIIQRYQGRMNNEQTINEMQADFDRLLQIDTAREIRYIMPNSMRPRPEFWEYLGKTDSERQALWPPAYHTVVKGVVASWDGEYGVKASYVMGWLDDHRHYELPDFLKKASHAPLTAGRSMDFYLYLEEEECAICGVTETGAWTYRLDEVPWREMVKKNADWEVARLCARLAGMLDWPRFGKGD